MKPLLQYAQKGLADNFRYTGPIDGVINAKCADRLQTIHFIDPLWDPDRMAIAYAQFRLNTLEGESLKVDGLLGKKTNRAWARTIGQGQSLPHDDDSSDLPGWMPGVQRVPRWNHQARPSLNPTSIILHRTAGHFATGDTACGKWGHPNGPRRKGVTLGFHFLVGKNRGEAIQFCSIKKRVSHVRRHSAKSIGIEISGDIGQYRDGLIHGEALTEFQVQEVARICLWAGAESGVPMVRISHDKRMFTHNGKHAGLLAHRDLTGNTHADSPNHDDWKAIMTVIGQNQNK